MLRLAFGAWPVFELIDTAGDITLMAGALVLGYRFFVDAKQQLLWRVRRKLTLSYIFIGFVPALLIVTFFLVSGLLLFLNIGAYMTTPPDRCARRSDAIRRRVDGARRAARRRACAGRQRPCHPRRGDLVALPGRVAGAGAGIEEMRHRMPVDRQAGTSSARGRTCRLQARCRPGFRAPATPASSPTPNRARRELPRVRSPGPTARITPSSSMRRSARRLRASSGREPASCSTMSTRRQAATPTPDQPGQWRASTERVDWRHRDDVGAGAAVSNRIAGRLQPHLRGVVGQWHQQLRLRPGPAPRAGRCRRAVPDHPGGGVCHGPGAGALHHRLGARAVCRHRADPARRLYRPRRHPFAGSAGRAGRVVQFDDLQHRGPAQSRRRRRSEWSRSCASPAASRCRCCRRGR